ncbi:MAG: hypothetical protein K6G81_08405 [Lachnospiraceae bacterium]|nr:hypothetical protein [Lachnospiraceae bacterium]
MKADRDRMVASARAEYGYRVGTTLTENADAGLGGYVGWRSRRVTGSGMLLVPYLTYGGMASSYASNQGSYVGQAKRTEVLRGTAPNGPYGTYVWVSQTLTYESFSAAGGLTSDEYNNSYRPTWFLVDGKWINFGNATDLVERFIPFCESLLVQTWYKDGNSGINRAILYLDE